MKKLFELKRGEVFGLPDVKEKFMVIQQYPERAEALAEHGYTLVEATEDVCQMAYDEGGNNDWRTSSLRKYLHGEYLEKLTAAAPWLLNSMCSFLRDLTADDGMTDYGTCEDTVSLLTADEYRASRDLHPAPGKWRWLLTPDSTPSGGGASFARDVISDGTLLSHSAYGGDLGVRPALYLESGISVSVEGEDDQETDEPTPEQKEMALYENAVRVFGKKAQILMAIEEMAELTKALLKYIRYEDFNHGDREAILESIDEERADVSIMLNQMEVIFGDNSEAELEKLEHLRGLLDEAMDDRGNVH